MSERLPRITAAELLRALQRDGWTIVRQKGHAQLKHPTKPGRVTIPIHPGVTLNPKTLSTALEQAGLSTALEQAGLSVDDLRRLL